MRESFIVVGQKFRDRSTSETWEVVAKRVGSRNGPEASVVSATNPRRVHTMAIENLVNPLRYTRLRD